MARLLPGWVSLVLACLILAACSGAPAAPTPWAAKPVEPAKPASVGEPGATTSRPLPAEPARPAAEPTRPAAAAPSGAPRSDVTSGETRPAPVVAPTTGSGATAKPAAAATTSPASAERGRGAPAPAEPAPSSDSATHSCSSCPAPTPPYRPTVAPYPQQQPPLRDPLRAGAVDDNARFDEYQHYLRTYRGPPAWPVDINERYLIAVSDADQRPVANSLVRVYHGQQVVFTGRTYAGGLTVFHPLATPDAIQATEFTVTAEKDGRLVTQPVQRGGSSWSLTLDGPVVRSPLVRLDLLFLIDSTGSMGGEIAKIQATLTSIADRITRLPGQPQIRFGGVTYRDRGDQYVTKRFGFTEDVQEFQRWLNGIRAGGGGDYPESLNEALHVAVSEMDWDGRDAVRLVFLVADAPPHLDYSNDYHYPTETALAVTKGIKLYTIGASGLQPQGEYVFRQLAQQTMAQYLFITRGGDAQSGGGPVSATNIQSPENNLDDIVVKIVAQEVRQLT